MQDIRDQFHTNGFTTKSQIPLHYPACDQLASRSSTSSQAPSELSEDLRVHVVCVCRPNSITLSSSLADRRPVRDQIPLSCPVCNQFASRSATSVMEYGLNRSATRFELSRHVEIARSCLRQVANQVCDQVCDLDSVMEFSQSRSQTSSRSSSRAR